VHPEIVGLVERQIGKLIPSKELLALPCCTDTSKEIFSAVMKTKQCLRLKAYREKSNRCWPGRENVLGAEKSVFKPTGKPIGQGISKRRRVRSV
jgi:hypothetical protein